MIGRLKRAAKKRRPVRGYGLEATYADTGARIWVWFGSTARRRTLKHIRRILAGWQRCYAYAPRAVVLRPVPWRAR